MYEVVLPEQVRGFVRRSKAEAIAWATAREAEIKVGKATGIQAGRTVGDSFNRYEKEVSATKRGHRFESLGLRRSANGRSTGHHAET